MQSCYILSCDSITKNIIILFFYNLVEEVMSISTRNQISLGQILCYFVSNAQGEIEYFLLFFFFLFFYLRSVIEVIKKCKLNATKINKYLYMCPGRICSRRRMVSVELHFLDLKVYNVL